MMRVRKARGHVRVDVDLAQDRGAAANQYDELRLGVEVAGQIIADGGDIRNVLVLAGRDRGAAHALPRHDRYDTRDGARRAQRGRRRRRADVGREHAPQPDVLALRRDPDHRGAVRRARRARRAVPWPPYGRPGGARPRGHRVADLDAHLLFPIRLHHDWRHCPHHRPRPGARAAAARRVLLRELRVRLRRQGGDVRAGDVGVARAAAAHGGSLPAGAARDRRRVRTRHPFTLLTLAAALPTLAWLLPAPAGALGTAAVAFGLAAAAGVRRVLVPAVVTAAPFWLFLFVLHDLPTTLAIGLRITTMVAGFVWLAAVLAPDRLVEAMVARGWSVTVEYVFAAPLSAVPLFRARARRIVEAQRCRGLSPRGSVAKRLRALRALALPLLLSALP